MITPVTVIEFHLVVVGGENLVLEYENMNDDPYEVLGLTHAADEAEIRQSYLSRVRKYPPELAPDEFSRTRAAYDALRDPVLRLETLLLKVGGTDTFDAIRVELVRSLRGSRFTTEQLFKLAEME